MAEKVKNSFSGFGEPMENWSKLPHEFIDALPLIETLAEMKVILYILRHTWGFHDDRKKMTLDEFENGRKRRDGSRLDGGTGMSRNSVKDGIKRALDHGFVVVESDEKDKARIKRWYALNLGGQTLTPTRGSEVDPHLSGVDPRTEKETYKKDTRNNTRTPPKSEPTDSKADKLDALCVRFAEQMRYDSDLITDHQERRVGKAVFALLKAGKIDTPADLDRFFDWYYASWRGEGGNPPSRPGRVLELWGEYLAVKNAKPKAPTAPEPTRYRRVDGRTPEMLRKLARAMSLGDDTPSYDMRVKPEQLRAAGGAD